MNEKEIEQLITGLKRSRDGFTHRYGKTPEQALGKRMTKRDREANGRVQKSIDRRSSEGGGSFEDKAPSPQEPPASSNFYARHFFSQQ